MSHSMCFVSFLPFLHITKPWKLNPIGQITCNCSRLEGSHCDRNLKFVNTMSTKIYNNLNIWRLLRSFSGDTRLYVICWLFDTCTFGESDSRSIITRIRYNTSKIWQARLDVSIHRYQPPWGLLWYDIERAAWQLTHFPLDSMAAMSQKKFWDTFS